EIVVNYFLAWTARLRFRRGCRLAARLDAGYDLIDVSAALARLVADKWRHRQRAFGGVAAADAARNLLHAAALDQIRPHLIFQLAPQIGFGNQRFQSDTSCVMAGRPRVK